MTVVARRFVSTGATANVASYISTLPRDRAIGMPCCMRQTESDVAAWLRQKASFAFVWVKIHGDLRLRYVGSLLPIQAIRVDEIVVAMRREYGGRCTTELLVGSTNAERFGLRRLPLEVVRPLGGNGADLVFETMLFRGDPARLDPASCRSRDRSAMPVR